MIIRQENERTIKVLLGHFFLQNRQRTVIKNQTKKQKKNAQKYFTSLFLFPLGSQRIAIGLSFPLQKREPITFVFLLFMGAVRCSMCQSSSASR